MKITISLAEVNINTKALTSKLENDRGFWTYAANTWHKLYLPYVPFDQGPLRSQVSTRPKEIEHTVPYAHYQYEGMVYGPNHPVMEKDRIVGYFSTRNRPKKPTGKRLKYKNPKASAKWDKAAEPTQKPKLIRSLQKYIDDGRLKLDG